ncbi:SCO3242 family prenyltransferase [Streptomyces corynorhini]|uniref:Prenyltransferase n=1 Tax=Streptomyces corynorhini TaxID=2282652 RepID=A0A370B6J5_9ACTN|nr:UbiA family prenyltransferase [Streptomyces corynorhini]RDG37457.1 prenyltransferase [Streptomyces corynorhini]
MSARDWAELLRVSALFTVPGDALAGAVTSGVRPGRGTALAVGASLCLYEAGMALNDWADRAEDARERPHRPIPSGRISPSAALAAAGGLTVAGLALAAGAGRPALAVGSALAATVWSYDLWLKHTPAGPAAMGAARALDLLLGATATTGGTVTAGGTRGAGGAPGAGATGAAVTGAGATGAGATGAARLRAALPSAALLGAHTVAVTTVSRRETQGGSTAAPLAALTLTGVLGAAVARPHRPASTPPPGATAPGAGPVLATALAAVYAGTAGRPLLHAALNPSPPLTQRAVGGGIRAMIPLQAALTARGGAAGVALGVMGLAPLARTLARKVSPT